MSLWWWQTNSLQRGVLSCSDACHPLMELCSLPMSCSQPLGGHSQTRTRCAVYHRDRLRSRGWVGEGGTEEKVTCRGAAAERKGMGHTQLTTFQCMPEPCFTQHPWGENSDVGAGFTGVGSSLAWHAASEVFIAPSDQAAGAGLTSTWRKPESSRRLIREQVSCWCCHDAPSPLSWSAYGHISLSFLPWSTADSPEQKWAPHVPHASLKRSYAHGKIHLNLQTSL